jgi:CheY-like chemotaxis protein
MHIRSNDVPDRHSMLCGRRVLVVEDEALVAMLLEDDLVDAGAEVVGPAGSVDEALQLIEQTAQDGGLSAAVLDLKLHGTMVSPVADQLAALGVPFVFVTSYGEDCDRGAHVAAPVLAKPFSDAALVATVARLANARSPGASSAAASGERRDARGSSARAALGAGTNPGPAGSVVRLRPADQRGV